MATVTELRTPGEHLTSQDLLYLATGQRLLAQQAEDDMVRLPHLQLAVKCEWIAKLMK